MWSHQCELDRDLAGGAPPDSSPEHATRARQLVSERGRRELLAELESALAKLSHPPHWHSASLPIQTSEVRPACAQLSSLRRSLLACERPSLRAAALTSCLVSELKGPVSAAASGPTVAQLAEAAVAFAAADRVDPAGFPVELASRAFAPDRFT